MTIGKRDLHLRRDRTDGRFGDIESSDPPPLTLSCKSIALNGAKRSDACCLCFHKSKIVTELETALFNARCKTTRGKVPS